MRILFISPVGALFSGAEVSILNLMEYLSRNGHQIYNVIPDNETNSDIHYIKRMEKAGIKYYSLRSLYWWWLDSKSVPEAERTAAALYQHQNISDIRKIIREEEIELVISNTVHVFQGAIAAALENCRHYYLIHEFPTGEFAYYKNKIATIDMLSDKIFAVHGGLFNELSNYFSKEKIRSFIPYTSVEHRELPVVGSKKRIVSIGGVSEWKNQLELIMAFEKLDSTELELHIIGGWNLEYKKICDTYIKEHSIKNIHFLGFQKDPWSFIQENDILVFPSKFEAFPLVLVETILNGLPYIASNNIGHQTVGDFFDSKHFYELGNIDELVKNIQHVLENQELYKQEAKELRVRAKEKYRISVASESIITCLGQDSGHVRKKTISEMASLLGNSLRTDILQYIAEQKITIYYSDEEGHFSTHNSSIHPIHSKGELYLHSGSAAKIRIDLSESFGVFRNVHFIKLDDNQEILPEYTNGLEFADELIFGLKDPQLIYDISGLEGQELVFKYEKQEMALTSERLFGITQKQWEVNQQLEADLLSTQEQMTQLAVRYEQLWNQYNSVVGSRRWTIPTKIINFFRRKK